jgi:hypothetical protein
MLRKSYLDALISITIFLLLYLFKPYPYAEAPREPIYFTVTDGNFLHLIAPTVLLVGSNSKAQSLGIYTYNLLPETLIKKLFPPGVFNDQIIPRENAQLVAKEFFLNAQLVKMVLPAYVAGDSLGWGLASVITGDPSISLKGLVAVTGTLLPSGQVGEVAGIATKAKSAQVGKTLLTFAPSVQVDELLDTFQRTDSASIPIGVRNISEAVGVLSLSDSVNCSVYHISKNLTPERYLTVQLPPTNKSLCNLLRNSKNIASKSTSCKKYLLKVFAI